LPHSGRTIVDEPVVASMQRVETFVLAELLAHPVILQQDQRLM